MIKYFLHPPRIQFFEFCDLDILPNSVRQIFMQSLNLIHSVIAPYAKLRTSYLEWGANQCNGRILDLASGGGDHIYSILKDSKLSQDNQVTIVLSDLFPQVERYAELQEQFSSSVIEFIPEPVDAMSVMENSELPQGISLFTGLHHFPPVAAQQLVASAIAHDKKLFIAEFSQRNWLNLLLPFFVGLPLSFISPFLNVIMGKQVSGLHFLLCCVIPVVPLMVCFDGVVSVLRIYRREELLEFIKDSGASEDLLQSGFFRCGGIGKVTYHIIN